MSLIELRDVDYRYPSGVQALKGVSLRIPPGTTAIIGENGAGKTTLVKQLNGLLRPTSGVVLLDGQPTANTPVPTLAATVGLVFQNPNDQIFNQSVWSEAAFGPRNLGFASQRVRELVDQALELVGLADRAADEPYALTLSERKLLCIASVVAMDTPVLVLDEPTTGQDQRGIRRMAELVQHLRSTGRSVIAITHDMEFVAEGFERTVVMAHGQVVLDADTRTVFGEIDLLEACGVEPPPITRLARLLGLRQTPLLIPEFVAAFAEGVGSHV